MATINRIIGLMDEAPAAPAAREKTPASGKAGATARSSKRGSVERLISLSNDVRKQDKLFRQIRRELMDEFRPETFTARMTVESVASDLIQVARLRQMAEALQQPRAVDERAAEKLRRLSESRRKSRATARVLAAWDAETNPELPPATAARLSDDVVSEVRFLRGCGEDKTPEAELEGFEREVYPRLKPMWATVRSTAKRLEDRTRVLAVFTGRTRPGGAEQRALRTVLAELERKYRIFIGDHVGAEKRALEQQRAELVMLARAPDLLLKLQRQVIAMERSIESKLKKLARD
jgi:hypothetical protein